MDASTHTPLMTDSKLPAMDDASNRYSQYMKHVKQLNIEDFAPPYKIRHTESPFQWIQLLKAENLISSDYLVKMDDYANQGDSYTFEKFIPYLALAFEYSLLNNFEEAKFFINKVDDMLSTMQSNNGSFYPRIRLALEHVFLATKTNIFILDNEKAEEVDSLKEKCSNLKPVVEMDSVQQAAMHALKSKFYLSCTTETELALTHMKEASRLDPTCATWKYWTGKILRKIRRDQRDQDPSEELLCFEEAVQMDRDAKYLVFLAQAYREEANYLYKNRNSFAEIAEGDIVSLNEQSRDLYIESVELNPSSAAICRRAGNGLMSLPKPYAKYTLAKHLLHKAEKLSRNPVTYHILGTYYTRHEENQAKAVEYFQKAADNNMVYGCHELIKIKYLNDPNYDPLEDLLKAAKSLEFSSSLHHIEGDIGWYYMVSQKNVHKGLEYFWKIIERNENLTHMKKFYSYSFGVKGPLNMYRVLKEKILDVGEESRDELMIRFLDKVNSNPQLLVDCGECISLEQAQKKASVNIKWERSKQKQCKDKYNQHNQFKSRSSKYQKDSLNKSEERRKWRKESIEDNVTGSSENQRTSAERAPVKQENWRLECRKF